MRALIVEDNRDLVEVYALTLQMMHIECDHVLDGKAALQHLQHYVPDLIILDMNLPQVSGHYIYKNIRADTRMDHVPVIISTANVLVASALAEEIGPRDTILVKPVSPAQLQKTINALA